MTKIEGWTQQEITAAAESMTKYGLDSSDPAQVMAYVETYDRLIDANSMQGDAFNLAAKLTQAGAIQQETLSTWKASGIRTDIGDWLSLGLVDPQPVKPGPPPLDVSKASAGELLKHAFNRAAVLPGPGGLSSVETLEQALTGGGGKDGA